VKWTPEQARAFARKGGQARFEQAGVDGMSALGKQGGKAAKKKRDARKRRAIAKRVVVVSETPDLTAAIDNPVIASLDKILADLGG
jgi:hypothetical protein